MTNKYFICCDKCFEVIGKYNTKAAKLWMDLCSLRMSMGEIITLSQNCPEIRDLELLGFLVSTDQISSISLRIKGYIPTEDGQHFFCIKEGLHE